MTDPDLDASASLILTALAENLAELITYARRLKAECDELREAQSFYDAPVKAMWAEHRDAKRRITGLEAALKPFADLAGSKTCGTCVCEETQNADRVLRSEHG